MLKSIEAAVESSCWNKASDDELVFVLLGRDKAAPAAVEAWCQERIRSGKNIEGDPQITEARSLAAEMLHQQLHGTERAATCEQPPTDSDFASAVFRAADAATRCVLEIANILGVKLERASDPFNRIIGELAVYGNAAEAVWQARLGCDRADHRADIGEHAKLAEYDRQRAAMADRIKSLTDQVHDRQQVVSIERERAEAAEAIARRLSDDCIVVLSGAKIGTPEKGYTVEPWALHGDMKELVRQRDDARRALREIAEARLCPGDFTSDKLKATARNALDDVKAAVGQPGTKPASNKHESPEGPPTAAGAGVGNGETAERRACAVCGQPIIGEASWSDNRCCKRCVCDMSEPGVIGEAGSAPPWAEMLAHAEMLFRNVLETSPVLADLRARLDALQNTTTQAIAAERILAAGKLWLRADGPERRSAERLLEDALCEQAKAERQQTAAACDATSSHGVSAST